MKIDDIIEQLTAIRNEHGNLEVTDGNDSDITGMEVRRYAKKKYMHNDNIIERHTVDLSDDLPDYHLKDDRFVESGISVQLY